MIIFLKIKNAAIWRNAMKIRLLNDLFRGTPLRRCLFAIVSIVVMMALTAIPAMAFDWGLITVHIVAIQTSFMPGGFDFTTDNTPAICNGFIFYWGQGADTPTQQANAKAVL